MEKESVDRESGLILLISAIFLAGKVSESFRTFRDVSNTVIFQCDENVTVSDLDQVRHFSLFYPMKF
jgi:hypothetical protein